MQQLPSSIGRRRLQLILLIVCVGQLFFAQFAAASETIDEVVVTGKRREQPRLTHAGNIDRLEQSVLEAVRHQHPHELLTRVSGAWLSRGSGQEHLTAIRSPVLTGAGSCGAFLFLEDSIPIRPAGFCNVNALFEINTEQSRAIELIRGPGNALYGSNALHGIINVLMPMPGVDHAPLVSIEGGANKFLRGRLQLPFGADDSWLMNLLYADDGGFRDESGYAQSKVHLKRRWDGPDSDFTAAFTYTDLDQETAGFIIGEDAYKDPALNRSNPNPEAFREASSARLYGIWLRSLERFTLDIRPYVRHTDMEFLQHFLPGQPLEENGHDSAGAIATAAFGGAKGQTIVGIDLEWSDLFLRQSQDSPTEGSEFLRETRPVGKHYDYDVVSTGIAAYVQTEHRLNSRLTLDAGLRLDYLHYEYDNRMLTGNTRDDGTTCGFGGCLYSRPADRSDDFTNVAPKLALNYNLGETSQFYAVLARGFRAPQATELYRLQRGQQVADLDSERIDSLELGVRTIQEAVSADLAVFAMNKHNSVFRDAEGFNVSGGQTRHRGIEISVDWQVSTTLTLLLDASYARHQYDFNTIAARGETFQRGREVDTAPRWLSSLELAYAPVARIDFGLQLTSIGDYYLDAENRFRYPGHLIGNLRTALVLSPRFRLSLRLNNITDRDIADRADYAFGNYRYFPGRGRELFAEIQYSPRSESL